jgi:hypothetical protein
MGEERLPREPDALHLGVLAPLLSALIVSRSNRAEGGPRRDKVAILANVG